MLMFLYRDITGYGFHKSSLPGRPASHGCVRLLESDAKWLFHWGQSGTPVRILGHYNFSRARPWMQPAWWSRGVTLLVRLTLHPIRIPKCRNDFTPSAGGPLTVWRREDGTSHRAFGPKCRFPFLCRDSEWTAEVCLRMPPSVDSVILGYTSWNIFLDESYDDAKTLFDIGRFGEF